MTSVSDELANQITDQSLSSDGQALYYVINVARDVHQLDEAGRLVWQGNYAGAISDAEATYLANFIQRHVPWAAITCPGTQSRAGASTAASTAVYIAGSFLVSARGRPTAKHRVIAGGGSA